MSLFCLWQWSMNDLCWSLTHEIFIVFSSPWPFVEGSARELWWCLAPSQGQPTTVTQLQFKRIYQVFFSKKKVNRSSPGYSQLFLNLRVDFHFCSGRCVQRPWEECSWTGELVFSAFKFLRSVTARKDEWGFGFIQVHSMCVAGLTTRAKIAKWALLKSQVWKHQGYLCPSVDQIIGLSQHLDCTPLSETQQASKKSWLEPKGKHRSSFQKKD